MNLKELLEIEERSTAPWKTDTRALIVEVRRLRSALEAIRRAARPAGEDYGDGGIAKLASDALEGDCLTGDTETFNVPRP